MRDGVCKDVGRQYLQDIGLVLVKTVSKQKKHQKKDFSCFYTIEFDGNVIDLM